MNVHFVSSGSAAAPCPPYVERPQLLSTKQPACANDFHAKALAQPAVAVFRSILCRLSRELVCDNVLSYCSRKDIVAFIQAPGVSKHFALALTFCVVHGNRLHDGDKEDASSDSEEEKDDDYSINSDDVSTDSSSSGDNKTGEHVPGKSRRNSSSSIGRKINMRHGFGRCIDCDMQVRTLFRCDECNDFLPLDKLSAVLACGNRICHACSSTQTCHGCGDEIHDDCLDCCCIEFCNGCDELYCRTCRQIDDGCDDCGQAYCESCQKDSIVFCACCCRTLCDTCASVGVTCGDCQTFICEDCTLGDTEDEENIVRRAICLPCANARIKTDNEKKRQQMTANKEKLANM